MVEIKCINTTTFSENLDAAMLVFQHVHGQLTFEATLLTTIHLPAFDSNYIKISGILTFFLTRRVQFTVTKQKSRIHCSDICSEHRDNIQHYEVSVKQKLSYRRGRSAVPLFLHLNRSFF